MKTKNLVIAAISLFMLTLNSCEAIKEKLTSNVDFTPNDIEVMIIGETTPSGVKGLERAPAAEVILMDKTVNINIAKELEKNKFSIDNIKSLLLLESTLELVPGQYTSTNIDLNAFKGMKLYFDDLNHLVAKVKSVDLSNKTISLEITNPELLDRLKNDQLHFILTGDAKPKYNALFKLRNKFRAKVGLK